MKTYEVVIEPEAGRDLRNIYLYIATNDTPGKAKNFLRRYALLKRCLEGIVKAFTSKTMGCMIWS